MDNAERIERACARAWPAQVEEALGEWRLRAAGGFTGRANSALAVGDPGIPVPDALDTVCDFAHDHRIDAMVQAVVGAPAERALAAAGWRPYVEYANGHEVSVLLGPLGDENPAGDAHVLASPNPGWWDLTAGTTSPSGAQLDVLTGGARVGYGVVENADGVTTGAVRGAVDGDLLLVARLAVRPEYRRRGLATALMAAAGAWARPHGATHCALQVAVGNTAALTLYDGLGFAVHHRYRYWIPRGACR